MTATDTPDVFVLDSMPRCVRHQQLEAAIARNGMVYVDLIDPADPARFACPECGEPYPSQTKVLVGVSVSEL